MLKAGSVELKWNDVEQLFMSEETEIHTGLHVCQLVVDGDSMSTEDFEVGEHTEVVNVAIAEGLC